MMIPIFLGLLAVESLYAGLRGLAWYKLDDTVANLSAAAVMVLTIGYFEPSRASYEWIERHWSTGWLSQSTPLHLAVAFVVLDLILYWIHRIAHMSGVLWAVHEVHHQSEEMNYSVALRHSSFLYFNSWLFLVPFAIAGFSADVLGSVHLVSLLYQFVVHTKAISTIPWLERVFVMPGHHRVHHARNAAYIDKNFGAVLIIWDRLFGTFASESRDDPVQYGIHRPLPSWGPFSANLIGFRDWAMGLWRPLAGRADQASAAPAHDEAAVLPVTIPPSLARYGLAQFLLCIVLLVDYLFGLSGQFVLTRQIEVMVLVGLFFMVPTIYDGDRHLWLRERLRSSTLLLLGAINWLAWPEHRALSLALMLWGGLSLLALRRLYSLSHQTA